MQTIDIALAAYNGEAYIDEQIRSIFANHLNDSDANLGNLYVSDNMSNDATVQIVRSLQLEFPNLLLALNDKTGVIANFNHAMGLTNAPYIMLADQDDVWFENKIALSYQKMKQLEAEMGSDIPLLVFTDLTVTDSQLRIIETSFFEFQKTTPTTYHGPGRMFLYNIAPGCTMLMNRRLLELACPVPATAIMHDWWLVLVAAAFGHVACVQQASMYYRQHENNQIGARRSSFLEKLLSPYKKYTEAQHHLQQSIVQACAFYAHFELMPSTFARTNKFLCDFNQLTRWQRIAGLRARIIQTPRFWARALLYAVAIFTPVQASTTVLKR